MSNVHDFVGLDEFLLETVNKLQVLFLCNSLHGVDEDSVVRLSIVDTREQILYDGMEKWTVRRCEYRQIGAMEGSHKL